MFVTETIYPADAESGSLDFKLVRFVRAFRAEAISALRSEARLQGYFATNPDHDSAKANAERADLRRRMTEIEDKIVAQGIPRAQVYRVGVSQSSLSGGQIVLTSGSAMDLSLPLYTPAVPPNPTGGSPDPSPAGTRPTWTDGTETEGSQTLDPKDKEVKTEVSITFKTAGVPGIKSIAATFALGPDGRLKEVGTELTLFKRQIAERWARGAVTDVQFAIKATASFDIAKAELEAKLKAVLSADIGIPTTAIRFGTELSAYTDAAGTPGVALGFTLFKF